MLDRCEGLTWADYLDCRDKWRKANKAMRDKYDGVTWVVWIDHQGKWHSSDYGWMIDKYADEGARQFARLLIGHSKGTASFIGTAVVAYCIHIKGRYPAIKMAKQVYKDWRRLLELT